MFLNFLKMFFGLVFPGTDECFKQRRYPTQNPSFVLFLYFSVHSIVCVCACLGSSFWLYYISSDELILLFFFPLRDMNFFFLVL